MMKKISETYSRIIHILKNIGFMFKYSWKIGKLRYFLSVINIIIQSATPFMFLILPKFIIDELVGQHRWDVVLKYIFLLIGFSAILKITNWGMYYIQRISETACNMRNSAIFIDHFLNMDYGKLEDSGIKDLGSRLMNNISAINFIDGIFTSFVTNLFQLIGYSYIIVQLHPIILAVILIVIYLNGKISKKMQKLGYDFQFITVYFNRKISYLFNSMIRFEFGKEIRINEASGWLKNKYSDETSEYLKKFGKNQNKEFKFNAINHLVNMAQSIVMYGYSAYMAIMGRITVGDFSVYLGAITNFTGNFNSFVSKLIGFNYLSDYVDDYKNYIAMIDASHTNNNGIKLDISEKPQLEFEFVDVSFKYPNTENYVIKNVSITIHSGERLSVVGYNGAGKSTFIKLLCRFYQPTKGKILLNGINISDINYDQYRDLLSVVFQDYQLFSFSIRENVVMDLPGDVNRIEESIEKSGLKDKIDSLTRGIDTSIGREFDEEGLEFSGGEGQKLACARAFYKNAPVVILDEPTASLDPIAESRLYERFNNIIGEKTAIYISHRLASVKFCDKIAVFANGAIVEYGTHHQLMQQKGVYEEMFSKQAQYYVEEESLK